MRSPGLDQRTGVPARPEPAAASAARPTRVSGSRRGGRGLRQLAVAAPFVLPSLAGVVVFLLLPVVIVLLLSFARWNFLTPVSWAGLDNFTRIARDYHVFRALLTSALYVLWNI